MQVLNVQVPLLFKSIVDALKVNVDIMGSSSPWLLAGSLIIGCTSSSSSYPPLTCSHETYRRSRPHWIYTILRAPQRNIRESWPGRHPESRQETFEHLLNLDLRFHLSRQMGGLTRAIYRGAKYVRVFCAGYRSADKEVR